MDGWTDGSILSFLDVCTSLESEEWGVRDPSDTGANAQILSPPGLGGLRDEPRDMVEVYRRGTKGL